MRLGPIRFTPIVILVATLVVILLATGIAFAAGVFDKDLNTEGNILSDSPDLGFYSDSACTSAITTLQWGSVYVHESTQKTVYLKNTGNRDFTNVNITDNLNPTLGVITSDVNDFSIDSGDSTPIVFTLSANNPGSISPTISFSASY